MRTETLPTPAGMHAGSTSLHGVWLLLARSAWLVLAGVALSLFILGITIRAGNLRERYTPTLGLSLASSPSGEVVLSPWARNPAIQAGILQGDLLVAVNGRAIEVKPGDPLDKVLPTGAAGNLVALKVRTGDHPARDVEVFFGGEDPLALRRLGLSAEFIATYATALELLFALVCLGIAGVIFLRKANDWLALLAALTFILLLLGLSEQTLAVYFDNPAWRPYLDLWFALTLFVLFLFFSIFPDGRFVPRWTQILCLIGIGWIVLEASDPRLYPWKMSVQKGFGILAAWLIAGVLVQVYRYRYHSSSIQRQQTKWVVFGMAGATLGLLGLGYNTLADFAVPPGLPTALFDLAGYPAIQLFELFLPLAIAIAILRHRLWDIDIIINRALVYGALTITVIALYVVVVGGLGTAIQGSGNLLISILATGLVAVLVQPLRDRLQRGVNRLMYGERDDPITVLSRLSQRLEGTLAPDAVLPSLVETVAQTLKLPYVAIETTTDEGQEPPAIAYGQPQSDLIRLPLIYQAETVGQLVVSPRSPGEVLSPMDHHLLENIAHQTGMAVRAVNLTSDLQRSRQRLVNAREEERRRLRRDLHDGLGPNLASQGLKLAAVKQLLGRDPASAAPLLDQVISQNQATVEDVRRLVYGLRPPALDELGLVAAIRDHVAGMDGNVSLHIEVAEPPGGLPSLSAAVEVAAYRIVLEALTNVIRHAQATHCLVWFSIPEEASAGSLEVGIQDNGIGLPSALRSGVGTRSMRERAEEVGGKCSIESLPGSGTRVRVLLPLN